jgi:3-deoxy-7-phosphoheptulonate synthase
MEHAGLSAERASSTSRCGTLADGLRFMEALGEQARSRSSQPVEFYTSHEGLNLIYESAQTRRVPRRPGLVRPHDPPAVDRRAHPPTSTARTSSSSGASPTRSASRSGPPPTRPAWSSSSTALNPAREPGKDRPDRAHGRVKNVGDRLRRASSRASGRRGSPCSGRATRCTATASRPRHGIKTRRLRRHPPRARADARHPRRAGTWLGGRALRADGRGRDRVRRRCPRARTRTDLRKNYVSLCDPRLNYQQSLELAFLLARKLRDA